MNRGAKVGRETMGYTGPRTRVGGANTHVETRNERVRVAVGEKRVTQ